jgi:hypothetical protein
MLYFVDYRRLIENELKNSILCIKFINEFSVSGVAKDFFGVSQNYFSKINI